MNQVSGSLMGVSVVLPILNEERDLRESVSAILAQNYSGAFEVILALGPSSDRTNEIAKEIAAADSRVVLVDNPTGRTANGLNAAIAKSRFPIVSRIDGHAEISPTYLTDATALLNKTGAVNVGGIMAAVGKTKLEKAVATAMRSPLGVGSSRFHVGGSAGPADTVYLGTFQKSALLKVGGYDERFTRAQDWELNFRLPNNLNGRVKGFGDSKNGNTETLKSWSKFHDYDFRKYKGDQLILKVARNLVDYEAGKTIFETALGIIKDNNKEQIKLF